MSKKDSSALLIGAHTSAAGGPHNALLEGKSIGATTIQLFTANQRQWKAKPLSPEKIALFHETLKATGLEKIMSHASYLLNLGSPNKEAQRQSFETFCQEIARCLELGISFLNFHPGAALNEPKEKCLDAIIQNLLALEKVLKGGPLRILLETTAGQGSSVGSSFEELSYILSATHKKIPIGICVDTCHIFAAGYDIRTAKDWEKTLAKFDEVIGIQHLYAFHLNDSMKDLGSRLDRHASLGKGKIGLECFKYLMTAPKTRSIPKYLETPEGPACWQKEIALLRDFAD